jgi:hypothetical protein
MNTSARNMTMVEFPLRLFWIMNTARRWAQNELTRDLLDSFALGGLLGKSGSNPGLVWSVAQCSINGVR